jgi:hypothetical protein
MSEAKSSEALFANFKGGTAATTNEDAVDTANQAGDNKPSEDNEDEDNAAALSQVSEIDMLKSRARLMGIKFSNNIGLEALKAKVNAKLEGETNDDNSNDDDDETQEDKDDEGPAETKGDVNEVTDLAPVDDRDALIAELQAKLAAATQTPAKVVTNSSVSTKSSAKKSKRSEMIKKQMRLVRLRITNLNPAKKDLPGEIFTFANSVLGAVRKYVPYGEATENGYHVPYCIYTQLKWREFLNIKVRKDSRGKEHVETNMAREFALEELPQLTERELAQLASSQAAAKGMD